MSVLRPSTPKGGSIKGSCLIGPTLYEDEDGGGIYSALGSRLLLAVSFQRDLISGFGGVYALGMFTRRAYWQGAMVGIIASILVTLAVKAYTPIHVLLYVGVAVITCVVVGYLVSLFFPVQHERLGGLTVFKVDKRH